MPRDFHTPVSFGLRFVAIGLLSLFAMLATTPAGAEDSPPPARDYVSRGHFESQADAQEVVDSGNLDELGRQSLDADGDGTACEDAFLDPDSPPPARDYVSCGHFDSQEMLDSGDLDELGEQSLDGDGDGIACEHAFDTGEAEAAPAGAVRLPNTGTGAGEASSNHGVMLASLILASGSLLLLSRKLAIR